MMGWEAPLMQRHAAAICAGSRADVLNVGFGLGIVDTLIQVCGAGGAWSYVLLGRSWSWKLVGKGREGGHVLANSCLHGTMHPTAPCIAQRCLPVQHMCPSLTPLISPPPNQSYAPARHTIIEAHPDVHAHMLQLGWDKKPGVQVLFGRWQDVLPQLLQEGRQFDGIFFDTYGEYYSSSSPDGSSSSSSSSRDEGIRSFHTALPRLLRRPGGIYSFFNGFASDNLFFHMVTGRYALGVAGWLALCVARPSKGGICNSLRLTGCVAHHHTCACTRTPRMQGGAVGAACAGPRHHL